MKTVIALITGTCIGFVGCYVFAQKIPSLGVTMATAEASTPQTTAPLISSEAIKFTNEDEGLKLQTNRRISYKDYSSTEGKSADLFRLNHQCKIRVTIGGEDSLNYRTFYFADNKLDHAMAATYHYPNDNLSSQETDNAFVHALFSEETLNTKNPQVLDEFKFLTTQFTPEQVKAC